MKLKSIIGILTATVLAVALSGCGDTWQGLKKDTGDNLEATGKAVEEAGEKIKD
jgi:predicted small secreted protein